MESDVKKYKLVYSHRVREQLLSIKNYIRDSYFSEEAGKNTVNNILLGLERLEVFPECGFDADERVGTAIFPPYHTRCIVSGDYLAFYHILEDSRTVFISNKKKKKTDYLRLFKKKD